MTSIILPRYKTPDGIAYHRSGNMAGIPVVLVHGVGLRSESWYQQVEALQAQYDVFAMDMPGHGESELIDQEPATLTDFVTRLASFIETVVGRPAVIIGHSMGALLALTLASRYPKLCRGVVSLNAVYQRTDEARQAVQTRAANLRAATQADPTAPVKRWFSDTPSAQDERHAAMCCEWLLAANLAGYAAAYFVFSQEDGPATADLEALDLPCLFITGALDANSNPAMSQAMAACVNGSEVLVISDSRHMTPLTHAEAVNPALLGFLGGLL